MLTYFPLEEEKIDHQNEDLVEDLGEEEDFEISNYGAGNTEDDRFDEIVGVLQEIVLEPDFEKLQRSFLNKHCDIFEDTEENKMEYMPIFKDYQKQIESDIETVQACSISP